MIYTARYSSNKLNNTEFLIVRISIGLPRYKLNYDIDYAVDWLKPDYASFHLRGKAFDEAYHKKLERGKIMIKGIVNKLKREADSEEKKLVFCCFEKVVKGNECHRINFAEWWKQTTGEEYQELDFLEDKQLSFFDGTELQPPLT